MAPADTSIELGETVTFGATGVYTDGDSLALSSGVTWTVSDTLVAVVVGEHRVRALGPGEALVSAGLEDLLATASLRAAGEGDLNADGVYDLLDAVRTVQVILEAEVSRFEVRAADLNRDGRVDILDLAQLIGRILGAPIGGAKPLPPGLATWKRDGTILALNGKQEEGVQV